MLATTAEYSSLISFIYRSRSRSKSASLKRYNSGVDYKESAGDHSVKTSSSVSLRSGSSCTALRVSGKHTVERDKLLSNWRKHYCATREEVSTKMEELSRLNQEDILEKEKNIWTRTTPADLYYTRDEENPKIIKATPKLLHLCEVFSENLVLRTKKVNELKPKYEPPPRKNRARLCKHKSK